MFEDVSEVIEDVRGGIHQYLPDSFASKSAPDCNCTGAIYFMNCKGHMECGECGTVVDEWE